MTTPPSKPFGRSLSDFDELLPAEKRLRDAVRVGELVIVGLERPNECTPDNEIRAGFLRFLALGGDEYAHVHEHGVKVFGAWISDVFDVMASDIAGNFTVCRSHFAETPVLLDAHFHGSLILNGSQLPGLKADRLLVDGNISLTEAFSNNSEIRLLGARIGGDFMCRNCIFDNPKGDALSVDRAKIEGNVYLDEGFQAQGAVRLPGASIKGDLYCDDASFSHTEEESAFVANQLSVAGRFVIRSLRKQVIGIDLTGAEAGTLEDDEESWGSLLALDGFIYHRLSGKAPYDATARIAWLNKQKTDHYNNPNGFRPQPWKQLIRTLRKMGHEDEARRVAIAYETHRREIGLVKGWGKQKLHQAFGWLADYGYRPLKLLKQMLQVWLACAVLYWIAAMYGVFAPSNPLIFKHPDYQHCSPGYTPENSKRDNLGKVLYCTEKQANSQENSLNSKACSCETSLSCQAENPAPKEKFGNWYLCPDLAGEYTGFSPLAYSLDLILPLVDLQQEHDWAPYVPTPDKLWFQELISLSRYHLTRLLVWFEILFGWLASLLLVAVVSGLTNRDKDD